MTFRRLLGVNELGDKGRAFGSRNFEYPERVIFVILLFIVSVVVSASGRGM